MDVPFTIYAPITEAFEKSDAEPGTSMRVGGFVSTDDKDRERDVVIQEGLDLSNFIKHGWFNDNHSKSVTGALGYPVTADIRKTPTGGKGTWVEGHLLEGYEPSMKVYQQIHALKKSHAPRKIGFSLQGKINYRTGHDGHTIAKAQVNHVAITHVPVNEKTGLEALHKALCAGSSVDRPSGGSEPGDAFPLRVESLEGKKKKKKKKKKLSKAEGIYFLMRRGCNPVTAERVWNFTLRRKQNA